MSQKNKTTFSYDQAITRLEKILADIQAGNIPLDRFEETLKEAHELVAKSRQQLHKLDETLQGLDQESDLD
jgi:exodeoxyribonuclease VII small subunit